VSPKGSSAFASTLIAIHCIPTPQRTTRSQFLCSPPKSSSSMTHSGFASWNAISQRKLAQAAAASPRVGTHTPLGTEDRASSFALRPSFQWRAPILGGAYSNQSSMERISSAFVDTQRILLRQDLQKFVDILCHAPARSVDDDMVTLPRFVFPRNDFLPSR